MDRVYFLKKYSSFSDAELMEVYRNQGNYPAEAIIALKQVLFDRGTVDALKDSADLRADRAREKKRIQDEVERLYARSVDLDFMQRMITSDLLFADEVNLIIVTKWTELHSWELAASNPFSWLY